jgi:hypothetical protein
MAVFMSIPVDQRVGLRQGLQAPRQNRLKGATRGALLQIGHIDHQSVRECPFSKQKLKTHAFNS